jgi:hypothetical protein
MQPLAVEEPILMLLALRVAVMHMSRYWMDYVKPAAIVARGAVE